MVIIRTVEWTILKHISLLRTYKPLILSSFVIPEVAIYDFVPISLRAAGDYRLISHVLALF